MKMSLLYDIVASSSDYYKNSAIIECDEKTTLKSRTFKEILGISQVIVKELSQYFSKEAECIGIFMNHNIYLISILISLQKLNKSFQFITSQNLKDPSSIMHINWILSFKQFESVYYKKCAEFSLDEDISLLWKKEVMLLQAPLPNIFCIMQTSGTTGKHKLIKIPYQRIKGNVQSLSKIFKINSSDVIFWGTPLTFDPSLIEFLLALLNGACLVIVPYQVYVNPYLLYQSLFEVSGVTVLQMVPSVFCRWDEYQQRILLNNKQLKILALGGEHFPVKILDIPRHNELKLYNLYGTTEVSCWATIYEVKIEKNNEIPLGENLEDSVIELRNVDGRVVNNGFGEIFIGSLTENCIIGEEDPVKMIKCHFRESGDIAEITEKGLFYRYRKNRVVKRYGIRINLSNIEEMISQTTGLLNRCVWIKELNKMIIYMVIENFTSSNKEKIIDKLRVKLLHSLPEASYPDHIDLINKLPLTCHGKIDDKYLAKIYIITTEEKNIFSTHTDQYFSCLCSKYLGLGSDILSELEGKCFIELGGNSISVLQLNNELKDMLGSEYPDDFLKFIFEKSLKYCSDFLKDRKLRKRKIDESQIRGSKKQSVIENYKTLWKYDLKACVDSSPAVFEKNEKIYVATGSFSRLFVVLNESGEEVFKVSLPDNVQSKSLISKTTNLIFIGCFDGYMYCFDFIKKKEIWKFLTGNSIVSSPRFCQDDSAITFGSYDEHVYCLGVEDGVSLWNQKLDGSIAVSSVNDPNRLEIYLATTRGHCYCLDELNGSINWKFSSNEPVFGSPVMDSKGGIVFPTAHNHLICLSKQNGELLWKYEADGPIFSSLTKNGDSLIFGCHDKNLYIVNPTVDLCRLVGKVEFDSAISTSTYVYEEDDISVIVAACNVGIIYVIDAKTCAVLKQIRLPNEIFSSPVVFRRKLYLGCRDNYLYCIDLSEYLS